jgi:hypothetical protein
LIASAFGQDITKQEIKSDVNSVIVYLDGAEVTRNVDVALKEGKNELIFKGISPKLNSKSMRVTCPDDIVILSLTSNFDYLYKEDLTPRSKRIKDSLQLITEEIVSIQDLVDAYNVEKQLLLKNQDFKSEETGINIEELKSAAGFFRERIEDINYKTSELELKRSELQTEKYKLINQLRDLNYEGNYTRSNISLLVSTDKPITTKLTLKYVVADAGWVPVYDIIAENVKETINISYRAKVYNLTEIDWKEVKVKLSTADPTNSASKPELEAWYLNFHSSGYRTSREISQLNYYDYDKNLDDYQYQQNMDGSINSGIMGGNQPYSYSWEDSYDQSGYMDLAKSEEKAKYSGKKKQKAVQAPVQPKIISVAEMTAEFEIQKNYSINSDGKPYYLKVKDLTLPTSYHYYTVPKKDKSAFLISQITGWEEANMVSGFANIYFNDTYIGKSFINTGELSDTLEVSLGRDNKILVERKQLKEFTKKQLIGTNRKDIFAYETSIKNNRDVPIEITIIDQIPVSEDNEIEVGKQNITDGANINELNGEVKWEYVIQPNELKKMNLSYFIKYPKNKPIKTKKGSYKSVRFM